MEHRAEGVEWEFERRSSAAPALTIRDEDATLLARGISYSDGIGMGVQAVDDDAEVRALVGGPQQADDSWIAVVDRGHGAGSVSAETAWHRLWLGRFRKRRGRKGGGGG
jgi:hypothetical protein